MEAPQGGYERVVQDNVEPLLIWHLKLEEILNPELYFGGDGGRLGFAKSSR